MRHGSPDALRRWLGHADGPVPRCCVVSGLVQLPHAAGNLLGPTKTTLTLSTGKVTYGHEQAEHLTITVAPRYSGTPVGKITVKAGSTILCTLTLTIGKGHCTLAASKLRPGTYSLVARYEGSKEFVASASAGKSLTVAR